MRRALRERTSVQPVASLRRRPPVRYRTRALGSRVKPQPGPPSAPPMFAQSGLIRRRILPANTPVPARKRARRRRRRRRAPNGGKPKIAPDFDLPPDSFGAARPAPASSAGASLAPPSPPSPSMSSMPLPRSVGDVGVSASATVSRSAFAAGGSLAAAAVLAAMSGTRILFLHFGQTTVRPAALGGTRSLAPHFPQVMRGGSAEPAAGFAGPPPAGAPLVAVEAAAAPAFGAALPSSGARPTSSPFAAPAAFTVTVGFGGAGFSFTSSKGASPMALSPAADFAATTGAGAGAAFVDAGSSSGARPRLLSPPDTAAFAGVAGGGEAAGEGFVSRSSSGASPIALSPPEEEGATSPSVLGGIEKREPAEKLPNFSAGAPNWSVTRFGRPRSRRAVTDPCRRRIRWPGR